MEEDSKRGLFCSNYGVRAGNTGQTSLSRCPPLQEEQAVLNQIQASIENMVGEFKESEGPYSRKNPHPDSGKAADQFWTPFTRKEQLQMDTNPLWTFIVPEPREG